VDDRVEPRGQRGIHITKNIVLSNIRTLEERAPEVLKEVKKLIDEAWDYEKVEDESLNFHVIVVLEPMAYGIYIDLLIDNLPALFMELRLLLETLAYCYMAKLFPEHTLDEVFERASASKVLKEFGEVTGLSEEPLKLWGKLS